VAILAQVVSKTEVIETDSGLAVLRVGLADSSGSIMALAFGYRAEVLDKQLEVSNSFLISYSCFLFNCVVFFSLAVHITSFL
jgi:hypothetical protein